MTQRRMLVNALDAEEVRVAVVEDGVLQEFYIERAARETLAGNIYKGRVVNLVPSLQAAFVDVGLGRNAFLHASEVVAPGVPPAAELATTAPPPGAASGADGATDTARQRPEAHERRPVPDLRQALRPGQEILVQVTREAVGEKGPSVSMDLSLPGRYLVLTPETRRTAISKRITEAEEREKLKALLAELEPPADVGVIIRTAGTGQSRRELQKDLEDLVRLWRSVQARAVVEPAPALLYRESDLVIRTIRDLFSPEIEEVLIDSPAVFGRMIEFVKATMPRYASRFAFTEDPRPLFHKFGVEEQIESIYGRQVSLPSGGSIVIEGTEALTAVDVNSGRLVGENPEEVAFRTNVEACDEIGRQVRLRDIGGVVVVDFIDMWEGAHRREVERRLKEALRRDRSRTTVSRMSRFGLVEMVRQKIRPGVKRVLYGECRVCGGTGMVRSVESMGLSVLRAIRHELSVGVKVALEVRMNVEVAQYLLNEKRRELSQLEERYGRGVSVIGEAGYPVERVEVLQIRF